MPDTKSDKAEQILRKMKKHDRKPFRPYQGPPDMDFLIQETTAGTGSRVLEEFNESTLDKVGELTSLSGITSIR
jgi:hypothetical protein